MSKRTFYINVDVTTYSTRTYEVEATSFDDARDKYERGYADLYDENEYDSEEDDIDFCRITCSDCDCDEDDCDCSSADVDEEFFADLGL